VSQAELPHMPRRPDPVPEISEKELMQGVIDTARIFGWRVAHFRSVPVKRGPRVVWETPVQADGRGFPDLVLVRERVLWVELKVGANTLSDEQAAWIEALREAGQEAHVLTDEDWHRGVIEALLRRQPATANAA
jgi:hypothetical protein